jgi:hypothetical protein
MPSPIDITFDFRSDTPPGWDPDTYSSTLRRCHQFLWSKPLPTGQPFPLSTARAKPYLHHSSDVGEFRLTSDSVIPTFHKIPMIAGFQAQRPAEELEEFHRISYTIGGMMVFPGNRVDGKATINGARGLHPLVRDRFDLTVECIRRHYAGEQSPLSDCLSRYAPFFALFRTFTGYVQFFLLQDLVTEDYSAVRFSLPFEGYDRSPLPDSLDSYLSYKQQAIAFIEARNRRILDWSEQQGAESQTRSTCGA